VSSEQVGQRLTDIIENIDRIDHYLGSMAIEAFVADPLTADAVERCLQRITEAVIKIGTDRMAALAPEVPVAKVRAVGNLLRHAYDVVDLRLVYGMVKEDLPQLRAAAARALEA
jgi:uncharacterized protein with HEPN domain